MGLVHSKRASKNQKSLLSADQFCRQVEGRAVSLTPCSYSPLSDNSYTKWDTYVPIVAMSVGVLSLGAGAVYIAGASAAAGSTSAAVAAISSRIGAQAALHAPTVRRLYAYAQKGQAIVKIGQVIGIGGGAAAGKLLGKDKRVEAKNGELEVEAKGKGSWLGFGDWRDERKNTKQAKKVLKSLLEGSVIR